MNKSIKGFITGFLVAIMLFSVTFSENILEKIEVSRNQMKMVVNGQKVNVDNFVYKGTTYAPVRAVSEMLGKTVNWDKTTNTINIVDNIKVNTNADESKTGISNINAQQDTNITIVTTQSSDGWTLKESKNFIFHFQPNTKVRDMDKYVEDCEKTFKEINDLFKAKLPKKIDYYVWNSDEDAMPTTVYPLSFYRPGGYIIHCNYEVDLGHEITHAIVSEVDGYKKYIPLIEEGLATHFGRPNEDKLAMAKRNLSTLTQRISIKSWWLSWPGGSIGGYWTYMPAAAFIEYLISQEGMEKMVELAKDQTYDNAKIIYGNKIDQYITDFEKLLYN